MRIEDLRIGTWYVISTQGATMAGAPVKVKEVSPPFVLVQDFMDDMIVIDVRTANIGAVKPEYVTKFKRMWRKQMARKRAQAAAEGPPALCVECGLPLIGGCEDDEDVG